MSVIIFDGKEFARKKEQELAKKAQILKKKGIIPSLETILDGNNEASQLYVSLKKKAAERIGVKVNAYPISNQKKDKIPFINSLIRSLNADPSVHGILVQLPLSFGLRPYTTPILDLIAPEKDVDGLRSDSLYTPAATLAVLEILEFAKKSLKLESKNRDIPVCVVGANGRVGRSIVAKLKEANYDVVGLDKHSRRRSRNMRMSAVLISVTGLQGNIKQEAVKEGAIVIDVGAPHGDVLFDEVSKKAAFITPVPGGVGPVTIACLLENLIAAASLNSQVLV